ncbi:MAG: TIGR02300 family protein [Pseudomonadota bacterium]
MVKAAWGTKRTCQSCGAHFYDLHKSPIACPKCGAIYDTEAVAKSRRGRAGAEKAAAQRPVPRPVPAEVPEVAEEEIEEIPTEGEEEEEELIEDTSELGEDEDVSNVIEKTDEDKEP